METTSIKLGEYEHFKSKEMRYEVLGVAQHSETLEEYVIYKKLYGDRSTWIRPLTMFFEEVEKDGKKVPRFKYVGK